MTGQHALAPTDVPSALDDEHIRQVLKGARVKLPSDFDLAVFAASVRKSAHYYLEANAEATAHQARRELENLYYAIERALKNRVSKITFGGAGIVRHCRNWHFSTSTTV